ncbi:MAG: hypothetical protein J0H79_07390 [Alphaproteobacteria bacterium]|nr:hypothetical protein [Alphaproteobacteria bacterium]OJU56984.1 MAG: hypothetical protein BGO00_07455 [Alphaproteobacteria bacterium 62-8]
MFEVGKKYEFRIIEAGDETTLWGVVERYEHPLIQLARKPSLDIHTGKDKITLGGAPGRIINVTSPNFISAVLSGSDAD